MPISGYSIAVTCSESLQCQYVDMALFALLYAKCGITNPFDVRLQNATNLAYHRY